MLIHWLRSMSAQNTPRVQSDNWIELQTTKEEAHLLAAIARTWSVHGLFLPDLGYRPGSG